MAVQNLRGYEISNNWAEHSVKPFVMNRKDLLFASAPHDCSHAHPYFFTRSTYSRSTYAFSPRPQALFTQCAALFFTAV